MAELKPKTLTDQTAEQLFQLIISHPELGPGAQLPNEGELCTMFGVSRTTLREAVRSLAVQGYVEVRRGKGTFVCQRRISRKLENLVSFTQACRANHMEPSSVVLERKAGPLTETEAEMFREFGGEEYLKICRLRMADRIPVLLENNYFPLPQYQYLLTEDLSGSLYRALDQHGIRIHANREMTLDVVLADGALAKLMNIGAGTPLFNMVGKNYDREGRLVHLGQEYIVCDRYHFSLEDYIVKDEDYDSI